MTDLLGAIGEKLTERWVAAILLPGLLFLAAADVAFLARQSHALDFGYIIQAGNRQWQLIEAGQPMSFVLATVLLTLCAGAAGLLAMVLAEHVVHPAWVMRGPRWWVAVRRRWATRALRDRNPQPATRYLPERASSIGDALRIIGDRAHAQYGLSILHAWPRLWILSGSESRTLVTDARRSYFTDATWVAWSLFYAPLTLWWWPAAVIAVLTGVVGYLRARQTSRVLASLIESILDVHQAELAGALGVPLPEGRITPVEGAVINDILHKRA